MFVSIHLNKFPQESCKGLQAFYSENNPKSKELADIIQNNIKIIQPDNTRKTKSGNDTIYLMEKITIPSVLIECGFISNTQEATMLSNKDYKKTLVFALSCSILEFLETKDED